MRGMRDRAAWHVRRERGSSLGILTMVWLYRHLGRAIARVLVYPIVTYFFLTDAAGRRASRSYLNHLYATPEGGRVLGAPPSARHVFRHYLEFGLTILDRVGFWLSDRGAFEFTVRGNEHLERVARDKRGALILGSHLGSFDAMRLLAATSPVDVHVLMFTRHAARINAVFARLDGPESEGNSRVRIVEIQPGSVQHLLEAKACIERGEVVAILADRVPPNDSERVSRVKFLGGIVALPHGPMILAGLLDCPVLLMTALRTGERSYEIHVERFADRVHLPRDRRSEAVGEYCQLYADRLASYCLLAPYQWFNFYEFWNEDDADVST